MAIQDVTVTFKATKTGGGNVFPGTGVLTATAATKSAADANIASQISALIAPAQQGVQDLVDAQTAFGS